MSSRIRQLLPSSVLEPTHVNLQELIVCAFSRFHNQHNGGFKLATAGIFTPQKLEELFKAGLFFLPDCWLFNNSLAHARTPLNSSLMLGFPSHCCMPRGHMWNPEDQKAALRRGALLRPFVKFFPLPWYILTWPLLVAGPVLITICIKSLVPVRKVLLFYR